MTRISFKGSPLVPRFLAATAAALTLIVLGITANAQQPAAAPAGTRYDITNYRIEAQLVPEQHMLRAGADITLMPLEPTRSLVFELNGSLKVESVETGGKALAGVVQDAVGVGALGPNVRVDLGQMMPANQPLTLRFRWSGALMSPEGGPLATRRLAYVGNEGSYLMYASRWFPFHDYAVDRATADITLVVPTGTQVAGTSDDAVVAVPSAKDGTTRYRFVQKRPELIGNFVAGQYISKTLRFGNYEILFFAKPGSENRINSYAELMGHVLEFYTKQYGAPLFGNRLVVAQVDDDTLDTYSGTGMIFLAGRMFDQLRGRFQKKNCKEKLLISGGDRRSG